MEDETYTTTEEYLDGSEYGTDRGGEAFDPSLGEQDKTLNYIAENFELNEQLSNSLKAERAGINKFGEMDILGADGKGILETFRDCQQDNNPDGALTLEEYKKYIDQLIADKSVAIPCFVDGELKFTTYIEIDDTGKVINSGIFEAKKTEEHDSSSADDEPIADNGPTSETGQPIEQETESEIATIEIRGNKTVEIKPIPAALSFLLRRRVEVPEKSEPTAQSISQVGPVQATKNAHIKNTDVKKIVDNSNARDSLPDFLPDAAPDAAPINTAFLRREQTGISLAEIGPTTEQTVTEEQTAVSEQNHESSHNVSAPDRQEVFANPAPHIHIKETPLHTSEIQNITEVPMEQEALAQRAAAKTETLPKSVDFESPVAIPITIKEPASIESAAIDSAITAATADIAPRQFRTPDVILETSPAIQILTTQKIENIKFKPSEKDIKDVSPVLAAPVAPVERAPAKTETLPKSVDNHIKIFSILTKMRAQPETAHVKHGIKTEPIIIHQHAKIEQVTRNEQVRRATQLKNEIQAVREPAEIRITPETHKAPDIARSPIQERKLIFRAEQTRSPEQIQALRTETTEKSQQSEPTPETRTYQPFRVLPRQAQSQNNDANNQRAPRTPQAITLRAA